MPGRVRVAAARVLTVSPTPPAAPTARVHVGGAVLGSPVDVAKVHVGGARITTAGARSRLHVAAARLNLTGAGSSLSPLYVLTDGAVRPCQMYVQRAGALRRIF